MKKKIKDLTKKQIYEAIFEHLKTSIEPKKCQFCKYDSLDIHCKIACYKEYETCIDYEAIIKEVGEEEIDVLGDKVMKRYCYLENTLTNHFSNEEVLDLARFHKGERLDIKKGSRTFYIKVIQDDMCDVYIADLSNQLGFDEYVKVGEID